MVNEPGMRKLRTKSITGERTEKSGDVPLNDGKIKKSKISVPYLLRKRSASSA